MATLELEAVRAGYGAINVLWDLSLTVAEGRLTAIVGPNGGGKTTLLRAVMGLLPCTAGTIRLDGRAVTGSAPWTMVRQGVAMVPEGRMVFRDMTVEDNLLMGAFPVKCRPRARSNLAMVFELFPGLRERRAVLAGALSGGEAQMLAMGRGLMEEPRILLVDEPSLGLAPVVVDEMMAMLAGLRRQGRTVVLVEQNTHKALAIADDVHLVRGGKVVLSQPAAEIDLARLHDLYFSRDVTHD